jgi:hypothetical protein
MLCVSMFLQQIGANPVLVVVVRNKETHVTSFLELDASSGDTILGSSSSSSSSSSLAGTNTIEHTLLVPMDDDMVRER